MKKAIFIHVPRTGGNSIKSMYYFEHDIIHIHQHFPASAVRESNPDWGKLWSFGFVRNPWARAVSLFYKECELRPEWQGQLKKGDLHNQQKLFHEWLHVWDGRSMSGVPRGFHLYSLRTPMKMFTDRNEVIVDTIFKFEDLAAAHKTIARKLKTPAHPRHRMRSLLKEFEYSKLIIDADDRERIRACGEWEIEKYGYGY